MRECGITGSPPAMKKLIESIERIRLGLRNPAPLQFDPRLYAKPAPRFELEGKRVLLAYLFSGLGDAVLLAPVVKALLDAGAAKPIRLLAPKGAARAFKVIDLPVKTIVFEEGEDAALKLETKLARTKLDFAVDLSLRDAPDARRFIHAANATHRLGWLRSGETLEKVGLDFGAPDIRTEATMHWSRYCALPLASLGVARPAYDVHFVRSKATAARALGLWDRVAHARVLLVPGGRAGEKRWDEERFIAIGRHAKDSRRASVVVTGGPNESQLVRRIARAIGKTVKVYTGKDLGVLVELVRSSQVVIGNDTGPMHLAFLLDIPSIAIFAYMSPLVWGPPKTDPRFVVVNARGTSASPLAGPSGEPGDDAWTRLARHHLDIRLSAL